MRTTESVTAYLKLSTTGTTASGRFSLETDGLNRTVLETVLEKQEGEVLVGRGEGEWEFEIEKGDQLILSIPGGSLRGQVDCVFGDEVRLIDAHWNGVWASLKNGYSGVGEFEVKGGWRRIATSAWEEPIRFLEYVLARNLLALAEERDDLDLYGYPDRKQKALKKAIDTVLNFTPLSLAEEETETEEEELEEEELEDEELEDELFVDIEKILLA